MGGACWDPQPGVKSIEAQTGWGAGGPTHSLVFKGGVLMLGKVAIEHPLTMVSTDSRGSHSAEAFPSNVGGGVLKRFAVTLDYDNSVMYLKPVKGRVEDLDTFDESGMWINSADGGFEVVSVSSDGPAQAAGLQKGDVITAVNERPVSGLPLYAFRERLRNESPGTVLKLTIRRGAATVTAKLKLNTLI